MLSDEAIRRMEAYVAIPFAQRRALLEERSAP
jgi:hypothetical protein